MSFVVFAEAQTACLVETLAGDFSGPPPGEGGPALETELAGPFDLRAASDGSLLISDPAHNGIRRVDEEGIISSLIGSGRPVSTGDGGPASQAETVAPLSVAVGSDGSVYFVESGRIRRIDSQGVVSTIAGNGQTGPVEFGVPAVDTPAVGSPIVVDSQGVVYALSSINRQVYRIGADGLITLFAGNGLKSQGQSSFEGEGGPAVEASLFSPRDLVVDSNDLVYILDSSVFDPRVLLVQADGTIVTYLGGSSAGPSPDGTPRSQIGLIGAMGLEIDAADHLYWSDGGGIRRVAPGGELETVVPTGGPMSRFAVTADGGVFVLRNRQALAAASDGSLTALAGLGPASSWGEGGPARNARIESVGGLAVGPDGSIYYADSSMARVRAIRPNGIMERVAGTGETVGPGDEGMVAIDAAVGPSGLAVDPQGRVLFSEESRSRLVRIETDGTLTRIAGDGLNRGDCPIFQCGDGGPARDSVLLRPRRIAADSVGNVYILQRNPSRDPAPRDWIRRITPEGTITTLAVPPPAQSAWTFTARPGGGVLVATAQGFLTNLWSYSADGEFTAVPGVSGALFPGGALAVHPNGEPYFEEGPSVRRFDAQGKKRQVVGDRAFGTEGGDGPAADLRFSTIREILLTPEGDLIIADSGRGRIFRVRNAASCPANPRPQISFGSPLRNGASFSPDISPGTIFSVFGLDLGPETLATAQLSDNSFPTEVGGTRVLVDGVPAPMIFSLEGQISGILPWGTDPNSASVTVEKDGIASSPALVQLRPASPAFFTFDSSGSGPVAALNQDGTVNTNDNPAAPGSIVVFFATGFGPSDPQSPDGALVQAPLPMLATAPTLRINGTEAELLYAGPAPDLVSGVVQLNARIPAETSAGLARVEAQSGDQRSPLTQVHVGP